MIILNKVLDNINLKLKKGDLIKFGPSGSAPH